MELVADLASWQECRGETRLRGWRPGRKAHLTLVESVRQDGAARLTLFEQEFVERRGSATVRTAVLAGLQDAVGAPDDAAPRKAGFDGRRPRLGSYDGDPWSPEAETWILVAERAAC